MPVIGVLVRWGVFRFWVTDMVGLGLFQLCSRFFSLRKCELNVYHFYRASAY